ncbi:MAG: DUF3791 domain-containing protein [Paludibacteraceae bacterium]|nr:DUF3791 domain-containing protein [Paludibacteraceae bacterium]
MLNSLNMWNKIGRIIALIAKDRNLSIAQAADCFYRSNLNKALHDEQTGLYLMSDQYVYSLLQ